MLRSYINGLDECTQIYGEQIFSDPPRVLYLTEGPGGSGIDDKTRMHLDGSGLSAQIYDQYWIPDPLVYSAFNGGGVYGMCDKQSA
jgi:hypothetical protein